MSIEASTSGQSDDLDLIQVMEELLIQAKQAKRLSSDLNCGLTDATYLLSKLINDVQVLGERVVLNAIEAEANINQINADMKRSAEGKAEDSIFMQSINGKSDSQLLTDKMEGCSSALEEACKRLFFQVSRLNAYKKGSLEKL